MNFILPASILAVLALTAPAAVVFTDWTDFDTANNTATGVLGPASVTLAGGDVVFGVTNGSFTGFNFAFFSTPIPSSDVIGFVGTDPLLSYTLTFSQPVQDPLLHVNSLAGTLTFAGLSPVRLSGQNTFTVSGSTVNGVTLDGTIPNDANGTVQFSGIFTSINFTAQYSALPIPDGISIQIGGTVVPEPSAGLLGIIGALALSVGRFRGNRTGYRA